MLLSKSALSSEYSRGQEWWDHHFMVDAKHVAAASRDPSTQCGAVIVRPDKTRASSGFNGFPRNMNDDPALYADRERKYKRVLHAEENALLFRRESVEGMTMYIWPFIPCSHCSLHIIQAGIARVVAPPLIAHPVRWKAEVQEALNNFTEAGVAFTAYALPEE